MKVDVVCCRRDAILAGQDPDIDAPKRRKVELSGAPYKSIVDQISNN